MTFDRETHDPAATLVLPARPRWRSLDPVDPPAPLRRRLALLLLLAALHALLLLVLDRATRIELPAPAEATTRVMLLDLPRAELPPPPNPRRPVTPVRAEPASAAPPPRNARSRRSAPPDPIASAASASSPPPAAARLFRADGSIELPAAVTAELERATSPERAYSYQIPGLAQAHSFAQRAAPLEYLPTRFDQHWQGDNDALTEWLEKAVEKTTATITIPIPRSPGSKIVCKVSLLAAGGACAILRNDAGYLVVLNDPNTLNAEEDASCQAWWNEVVGASTYEQWRAMHERYEAACKQPLEQIEDVPSA